MSPDYLAEVRKLVENFPHCLRIGLKVLEMDGGKALFHLPYRKEMIGNPDTGVIHGGAITALLDTLGGAATFTAYPGPSLVTLDLRIDYLKPATPGMDIYAAAEVYKHTKTISFVRGQAYHQDPSDPIANMTATYMVNALGFEIGK